MNIIYLATSTLPSKAANSVHVMKMCSSFSSCFDSVTLVARGATDDIDKVELKRKYGTEGDFRIVFSSVGEKSRKYYNSIFSVLRLLLKYNKMDTVVYGRDLYSCLLASVLGFKFVYESHGISSVSRIRFIEKFLFSKKNFIGLVVISKALKSLYLDGNYGLKSGLIEVAHDGADIVDVKPSFHNEKINVTYIGHLYKGRGIDIIIASALKLSDVKFTIVGGREEDISYWRARSPSNVLFIGHVDPVDTVRYRDEADILVMPYQRQVSVEGGGDTSSWMSPMKLFEYMSAKKAIISSDLPVLREVLNEENAMLVEPDCVDSWVEAINKLNEVELRNKIAVNAYEDFLDKFTWDMRAKNIAKFITRKL